MQGSKARRLEAQNARVDGLKLEMQGSRCNARMCEDLRLEMQGAKTRGSKCKAQGSKTRGFKCKARRLDGVKLEMQGSRYKARRREGTRLEDSTTHRILVLHPNS